MRARFLPSSDGVTIALHDLGGRSSSEPLVICHATGFCGRAYEPLAAELSGTFHVFSIDFRGHGDSSAPANRNFDWRAIADDLLAAITAVGGGHPVTGFGHSLGGAALMIAEARRPGTLRAAYLYEPVILPSQAPVAPEAGAAEATIEAAAEAAAQAAAEHSNADHLSAIARKRRSAFPSKAEALLRYASRPPLNALQAGALAAYVEHGMIERPDGTVQLKCRPEDEAAVFEADGKPTTDDVRSVKVPTVVAVGAGERGWSPAHFGPAIAGALPHGQLEQHPLLGHFGPLQGPITVGAMLLAAAENGALGVTWGRQPRSPMRR